MLSWLVEEERYLRRLRGSSTGLSQYFLGRYKYYRSLQGKLRLPAIILSSMSGVASFGTTTFPRVVQRWVSVVVGGVSIVIAILNTVEAYMKVAELLAKASTASTGFKKLADDIQCELDLPAEDRQTSGVVFVRESYARFQQIIDQAPPIEDPDLLAIEDGGQVGHPRRFLQAVSQLWRGPRSSRTNPETPRVQLQQPELVITVDGAAPTPPS